MSKKIVVKKRFVAKHLSETFAKIQMGEEREIIVTWSRASTIIPSMVSHVKRSGMLIVKRSGLLIMMKMNSIHMMKMNSIHMMKMLIKIPKNQ